MKQQSKDTIWYDEKLFLLESDSSHRLPLFDRLGVEPRYKSSDCLRGYLAIYEFINSKLYLTKIAVGHSDDFDKYQAIDGIHPKIGGYRDGDVLYDLRHLMSVDTTITIGAYEERNGDVLRMKRPSIEVLKLRLKRGQIKRVIGITQQVNDLHAKIQEAKESNHDNLSHLLHQYDTLMQEKLTL